MEILSIARVSAPHQFNADPGPAFNFHEDPDPAVDFYADPDPAFFTSMRIRIRFLLLIKVIRICDH
jgi:hypothetical protein